MHGHILNLDIIYDSLWGHKPFAIGVKLPTIFTHSLVGLAAAKVFSVDNLPKRFWVLSFICPSLPDLDYFGMSLWGIPYEHILGHRGFTHSFVFAASISLVIVLVFFRDSMMQSRLGLLLIAYFTLIISSHGLLDGLTNGGLGVAYFFPLDNERYFLPFRPIEASPFIDGFFGKTGLKVMLNEILLVWIPLCCVMILSKTIKRVVRGRKADAQNR